MKHNQKAALNNLIILLLAVIACAVSACSSSTIIDFKNPGIHYSGRVKTTEEGVVLSWTASSAIINFNGTGAKATLNDNKGNDWVTVIVDNKVVNTIRPKPRKKEYELVADLPAGPHKLELFKRTESNTGDLTFYNFALTDSGKLLPPPKFKHTIEFYGNSITCGYSLEDLTGEDRGYAQHQNGYKAYGNLTARHFNAEYYCIAKSGIGITVSFAPVIMAEVYNRLSVDNSKILWDFKKFTPEIVVINLFQNDYKIVNNKANKEFKRRFGKIPPTPEFIIRKYQDFVKDLRSKYPKAKIICTLGSMDSNEPGSPFPGYIEKAVKGLSDKNIYTLFYPYLGAHRHPNEKEHQAMANILIKFIETNFGW